MEMALLPWREAQSNSPSHQVTASVPLRRGRVKDCMVLAGYKNGSRGKQRLRSKNRWNEEKDCEAN